MKQTTIAIATTAFWIGFSSAACAQATCARSGPGPDPVDPTLAPRIIAWATEVEAKLGLTAANWRGEHARATTPSEASALELQALITKWEDAAAPGTVEATYRAAVAHGVNAQVEMQRISTDPANAKTHRFWVDMEAARAQACLSLIQLP